MREIGSEFWSVPTLTAENHFFPGQTQWLLSGRSALMCILQDIRAASGAKTAALPAWCCDSMVRPFLDAGISVSFYPVYHEQGQLKQDVGAASGCDILFLMDYFGYTGSGGHVETDAIVIRDLTHSVFSGPPAAADYCFGSLRKWAGFHTGGFGWGFKAPQLPENDAYIRLRADAMSHKARYIRAETDSKDYLQTFAQAEELLEVSGPAPGDARDVSLANSLDISGLKHRRRENAALLLEEFADIAVFPELKPEDCPLFVPILVPDGQRDALRRHLIQHSIYCPVHWPLTPCQKPDRRSMAIYRDELSLLCDQRYGPEDMRRIVETVKSFRKE